MSTTIFCDRKLCYISAQEFLGPIRKLIEEATSFYQTNQFREENSLSRISLYRLKFRLGEQIRNPYNIAYRMGFGISTGNTIHNENVFNDRFSLMNFFRGKVLLIDFECISSLIRVKYCLK